MRFNVLKMKPIKVLNVFTGHQGYDGISSVWLSYITAIRRDGSLDGKVEMDIVAMEKRCDMDALESFVRQGCGIRWVPDRQEDTVRYWEALRRLAREGKYDIVHANGSSSLLLIEMSAAKAAGVSVRVAHSHNTRCFNMLPHRVLWYPFQSLCTHRLACGRDAGRWLFGRRPFTVVNNGKDLSLFAYSPTVREKMRNELGVAGRFVVGNVGALTPGKNQEYLIRAFGELKKVCPRAFLLLLGRGRDMEARERQVREMGLEGDVRLAGFVTNVQDYLQAMDVVGFPSKFEGLPNVLIEWQAAGLPCVISDSITRECGVTGLVEYRSVGEPPSAWAKRLWEIQRAPYDRAGGSAEAIRALRRAGFDIRDCARSLVGLYEEACSRSRPCEGA